MNGLCKNTKLFRLQAVFCLALCLMAASAVMAEDSEVEIELLGHLGGSLCAVDVDDSFAYIGEGPFLSVLDVSNPAEPLKTASLMLSDIVRDVFVTSPTAYVAMGGGGLAIVDVSEPTSPVLIAVFDTPGFAQTVLADGDMVYVGDGPSEADMTSGGLLLIDALDATTPTLLGSLVSPAGIQDILTSGGLVFAAEASGLTSGGLRVFDFALPSTPTLHGSYDTPGSARGVGLEGDLALLTDSRGGLVILDVSDPALPSLLGSDSDDLNYPRSVQAEAGLAFVTDDQSGLLILDTADPTSPLLAGSHDTPGEACALKVADDLAYVADRFRGLLIFDVANPEEPELLGAYEAPGHPTDVDLRGNLAHVMNRMGEIDVLAGLDLYQINKPAAPLFRGSISLTGQSGAVAVSGNTALALTGSWSDSEENMTTGGLRVVNVTHPATPQLTDSYDAPGTPGGIATKGNDTLLAFGEAGGFQSLETHRRKGIEMVDGLDTPGEAEDIDLQGNTAYVADGTGGLRVINIHPKNHPALIGTLATSGTALGLVAQGNRVYVADGAEGLLLVDATTKTAPVLLSALNTTGTAEQVDLGGNLAFVADGPEGLLVIDVDEPSTPTLLTSFDGIGYAEQVTVKGNKIYVTAGEAGLYIFQLKRGAPDLEKIEDVGDGVVRLKWKNRKQPPAQFLGFVWDLYEEKWLETGAGGSLWHPFSSSTLTGEIPIGNAGGYYAWISNHYPDGEFIPTEIPQGFILYSGQPHKPIHVGADNQGQRKIRLRWKPDPMGTFANWMLAFNADTGEWTTTEGPLGNSLWHFVAFGSPEYVEGATELTLPSGASYWIFVGGMGWDGETWGDFASTPVTVP